MTADVEQCRVYLITPPKLEITTFADELKSAFDGGDVACLQLRLKNIGRDDVKRAAEVIHPICQSYDVAFLLNDDPHLAKEIDADGVHVGEDDATAEGAREVVGEDKIVGVSCYNSKHRAMEAGEQEADYIAFGAFYPTQTKQVKAYATPDLLEFWSTYTTLPCVAIGGITPDNCQPLVRAGADFICMISAVWQHVDGPEAAIKSFNKAIASA